MKIFSSRFRRGVSSQQRDLYSERARYIARMRQRQATVSSSKSAAQAPKQKLNIKKLTWTQYLRLSIRFAKLSFKTFVQKHRLATRITAVLLVLLLLLGLYINIYDNKPAQTETTIPKQLNSLIGEPILPYATKLTEDGKGGYAFNKDYAVGQDTAGESISPKISGKFDGDRTGKVGIDDPQNNITLSFTPKFLVSNPLKDANRIVYLVRGKQAATIYTLKGTGVKEDIVLNEYQGDTAEFTYELGLPDGTEVRMEQDGSVAVYGVNTKLLGNVSTGTDADKQLLDNARKNGEKNVLLFKIPAPFVKELNNKTSSARAWFSLDGTALTVHASALSQASYPLSIDPSIYVETAQKLMRGNNESNINFDTTNELIQKSNTTGARINGWVDSTEMNDGTWDHSVATAGGYVYKAGGRVDPTMPYIAGTQSTTSSSAVLDYVVNMPAIRPAGDLYVVLISHRGTGAVSPPSGWTEYADTREHAAYYKEGTDQGGGNEAASYTFNGSSAEYAAVVLRIKNFNVGSPISGSAGTGSSASAVLPDFPATGSAPTHDATLVVRAVGVNADQPATYGWLPMGHTRVYSGVSSTVTASSAALLVATLDQPPLATNSVAATALTDDGLVEDTYGASTIAIRPATVTAGYQKKLQWSQINSTTRAIDSPNPGGGVCSGWCTSTNYDLPFNRIGMQLIAYNGYLYAMGGSDGTTRASTVYIAKLGANGEPQLWHPSGGTPAYWYQDAGLNGAVARSYFSAYAYNNKMYVLGGQTNASPGGVTTVESATIGPNGVLGAWTATGMQALPDVRHSFSVHVYNDVMYLIGGNSNGTLRNTVYYSKLNSDGTMNAWTATSSFTSARSSFGGTMTGLWGAYIYLAGGCTALTSGYCSTIASDVQLASINADGTLAPWNGILNLSNQRIGYSFIAWQNGLYRFGGCNRQNTSTGVCYATHRNTEYGSVNPDGDASTVNNSDPAGFTSCGSATPLNCDLPDAGKGIGKAGQASSGIVVNNGYIYVVGGCVDVSTAEECYNSAAAMSGNTAYAAIDSNGNLSKPSTCTGGTYGTNAGAGTITQSGNTITGSGTAFTANAVGSTFVYADGTTTTVSSYSSATSINVALSTTIGSAQSYSFAGLWCVVSTKVIINPTITYQTGTLTQSGTTLTGSGTTWVAGHVGTMVAYEDGTFAKVTARSNNTTVTVDVSKTIGSAQSYRFLTPTYNTGTYTQSGNTITGSGTTWTATHVGMTFTYNDGTTALITARSSNTSITVNVSKTVASASTYGIYVNGTGTSAATVFNNTIYIIGGTDGDNWHNKVYRMPLNSDGSLGGTGTWRMQNFTGLGLTGTADDERGYLYSFTRGKPTAAATNPGNLYIFGGCSGGVTANGLGCNTYYTETIKCNIGIDTSLNTCTTSGQLQIDADNLNTGSQGLGLMAGTIYANRVYLVGGSCSTIDAGGTGDDLYPCGPTYAANRKDTIFARIDNSNNIVAESGGVWQFTTGQMNPVRRRAVSFGYNGYIYSLAGYTAIGTTSLQDLLFAKINVSTGDVANFSSSGVVVTPRWDLRAIVSNGYVYAIGGCGTGTAPIGCTALQPEVQTFQLYNNDSGAAVGYTAASDDTYAANTDRWGASAAVLNGIVYVAGGCISATDCTNATNDVEYAKINTADGSIGSWQAASNVLPLDRTWGQLEVAGGNLYYIGGQDDTATNEQSTIYYATTFNTTSGSPTEGNITAAWATASGALGDVSTAGVQTAPRTKFAAAVWNNRIYVVGGLDGSAANTSTVYISPRLPSGGNIAADSWTLSGNSINVARRGNALIAYANNLYMLGGNNGTNYFNDVQYTTIGYKTGSITQSGTTVTGSGTGWTASQVGSELLYVDGTTATITGFTSTTSITVNVTRTIASAQIYTILDGSISSWSYTTSLPSPISEADGFGYNGYLYLIGGRSATSTCVPNTILSPVSANTTIVTGNNPTGVGEWYETNQRYTGDRYGAAVTYANGKAIVLGGGCTAPLSANRHYYTSLKSQPQIAKYSRLIDTDTDVFPTGWLLNGVDNATGAEWRMRYSSMNDIDGVATDCGTADMSTYGQETNFGVVQLGRVESYIPRDGSNNNINCARYFYFSINIDSQQAFGYPEDVSRGPTIQDLSLFFTSDPSKRLRHGKTFTGGEQQPLDTPCRVSGANPSGSQPNCPNP